MGGLAEREKQQRLIAGILKGADVNLGLVRLPKDALMFPNPVEMAADLDLTTPRGDRALTKEFGRRAKKVLGFRFNFHWLRGTHETQLLRALRSAPVIPVYGMAFGTTGGNIVEPVGQLGICATI